MNEEKKLRLTVASSPHVASPIDTTNLMRDVLIALVPAMVMGVVFFGPRALVATIISVLACEFFEWGYRKLMHKSCAVKDLSAAVTGVLLAFVCAPTLPYWMLIIGDFFAIVVVKQLFGGLGKNFMNPALGGRAFLMLCYPVAMTTWVAPGIGTGAWADLLGGTKTMAGVDIVSSATPLSADFMHGGLLPDATILDTFVGNVGGCIGEISALALLLGGVYLIVRGVIRARIPVAYIATVAVLTFLFPLGGNDRLVWMTYQLFTGGLFLGAFFMATDYVTSPVTKKGEIIFGIGCGLLTVFIRYFGGYPEGVSYSILIMNCCVWLIDKVGKPGRYGVTKEMKAAAKAAKKAGKEGYAMSEYTGGDAMVQAVYKAGDAGYVVEVKPATSFSGNLTIMVGVDNTGACSGISITSTGETSGLGSNASKPDFQAQFVGKTGEVKVTKDGGDIDALTGATITSRGVCEAVTSAIAAAASMG